MMAHRAVQAALEGGMWGLPLPFFSLQNLTTALITMGHSVHTAQHVMNVVQGISQEGSCIFPYSDRRKRGEASGY